MRGHLRAKRANRAKVVVDSRVEVYRDPERSHGVYARKGGEPVHLGVSDGTVSRLKDEVSPVVIEPRESCIEVRNRRNSNGVTVRSDGGGAELSTGTVETVSNKTEIVIGYQTTLVMTVDRESKINIEGSVDGDVIAGDQTNVDDSTRIVDSVVNRSEVGGDGSEMVDDYSVGGPQVGDDGSVAVDDSVVNRSQVGGDGSGTVDDSVVNRSQVGAGNLSSSDTKTHCETHSRVYTGEVCPECRAEQPSNPELTETKFCRYCGTEISAVATVCPECENRLER